MIIDDVKLPSNLDPRLREMLSQINQILNEGQYQETVTTQPPVAGSAGQEGEVRIVVTGGTMTVYKYASGSWWSSEAYTEVT